MSLFRRGNVIYLVRTLTFQTSLEVSKRLHYIFLWRLPIQSHSKLSNSCQTQSSFLDISSATVRLAPDLLKTLSILSDTTVKRSAVDWADLKPYWKSEKRLLSQCVLEWICLKYFTIFCSTAHNKFVIKSIKY